MIEIFGEDGLFSKHLEFYEARSSQIEMANGVVSAFEQKSNLIVEAPTGVGKSFGYLVPAIKLVHEQPSERVVVATANIVLQEQLIEKDLPFLSGILPYKFNFKLIKGRNNYLCLRNLKKLKDDLSLVIGSDAESVSKVSRILKWANATETGDKSELDFEPGIEWHSFSSSSDDCFHKKCPYYQDCYVNKARMGIDSANIIVCNYHVLFSDLQVRQNSLAFLLPDFKYLVCDEGHKLVETARSFFGWIFSEWHVSQLVTIFEKSLNILKDVRIMQSFNVENKAISNKNIKVFENSLKNFKKESQKFFQVLSKFHGTEDKKRIKSPKFFEYGDFINILKDMEVKFKEVSELLYDGEMKIKCEKAIKKIAEYIGQIEDAVFLSKKDFVYYTEVTKLKKVKLVCQQVDVKDVLRDFLFALKSSTIVTSATLAIDGDCSYMKTEMGFDAKELIVPSPFDFASQCALVYSNCAPDPKKDPQFSDKVAELLESIVYEAKGRTLALFTSWKGLNTAKDRLSKNIKDYKILAQGDAPRMKLIEEFKNDVTSVLLGTESFWEGIDVPGEALSCIVIDKLPFKSPADPVWSCLCDRDSQWFKNLEIPDAVISLKQGVGRLIRRNTDKGVIVILDRRIASGYGKLFIKSLPPMPLADGDIAECVKSFFEFHKKEKPL